MKISIEQHFFTSGDPEFTTVGMSSGITENDKIILEQHSLYFLPEELLYNETTQEFPEKYIFYRTHDKFVIGRAVYTGIDSLGRPGNYFFHNLLISQNEFYMFHYNPVQLIDWFLQQKYFKNSLPDRITSLEINTDIPYVRPRPVLSTDSCALILKALHSYPVHQHPLLFRGNREELLDCLNSLFSLISFEKRKYLFFDSYSFGVSNSFPLLGLPVDTIYKQSRNTFLEANLISGAIDLGKYSETEKIPNQTPLYSSAVNLLFGGNAQKLDTVYELEELLNNDKTEFINKIWTIQVEEKSAFFEMFRDSVISYIIETADLSLFQSLTGCLLSSDIDTLYKNMQFRDQLLLEGNDDQLNSFIDWLLFQNNEKKMLFLLEQKRLSELFFSKEVEIRLLRNFYDFCRKQARLLIVEDSSMEKFFFFSECYNTSDYSFFFEQEIFRTQLIELKNTDLTRLLLSWVFKPENKKYISLVYPGSYLFSVLLDELKTKLEKHYKANEYLQYFLLLCRALGNNYVYETESALFEFIFEQARHLLTNKYFVDELFKCILKYPETDSITIVLIREFLLSVKELKLRKQLLSLNYTVLTAAHRELIYDFLSALIIRKIELKKISGYLQQLLKNMPEEHSFMALIHERISVLEKNLEEEIVLSGYYLYPWEYNYLKEKPSGKKKVLQRLKALKKILNDFNAGE